MHIYNVEMLNVFSVCFDILNTEVLLGFCVCSGKFKLSNKRRVYNSDYLV